MEEKRVCMFVWNHFTNDARVLRECTTLSNNGYHVDLICIDDPNDKSLLKKETWNSHFTVFRLQRYPYLLLFLRRFLQLIRRRKLLLGSVVLLWFVFLYDFPIFTTITTIATFLLLIPNVKTVYIRSSLIVRMIIKGYRTSYDIYHANDLNTLLQGYICAKWRLRKKVLIYDSHEVQTSRTGYDSRFYHWYEQFLIKKIDQMIVENNTRAKYNEHLYGFYPAVVHNYPSILLQRTFEQKNLHQLLELPKEEKILLYQGGIQQGRGLEKLIEAYPLFNEGILLFIGDGKIKEQLQRNVQQNGLQKKIYFLPKVPMQQLLAYTKNAYLGFQVLQNTCFNHWSASSNKLFEYMLCEVPVVACHFPEVKRVVEKHQVGKIVDSHNVEEIANGVNFLLENKDLWQKYKNNCSRAYEHYTWENEQNKLLEVYRGVTGYKTPTSRNERN